VRDDKQGFNFPVSSLNNQVLGIKCTGGEDKTFFTDYKQADDLYRKYEKMKPAEKEGPAEIPKKRFNDSDKTLIYTFNASGPFSILGGFIGDIFDTLMYPSEDGQILNVEELSQVINLFSYDVGLFDFSLSKHLYQEYLSNFAQRTAAVKLAKQLNILLDNEDTFLKAIRTIASIKQKQTNNVALDLREKVILMLHDTYHEPEIAFKNKP
jgi:hypothetical protein